MSCEGFFDEYIEWAEDASRRKHVWCTLVTNQKDGLCTYAQGRIQYTKGSSDPKFSVASNFEGNLTQMFSDRVTDSGRPFSLDSSEVLGVRITLSDPPMVRASKGTAHSSFSVACSEGVLMGSPPGQGMVLSLQKIEVPA